MVVGDSGRLNSWSCLTFHLFKFTDFEKICKFNKEIKVLVASVDSQSEEIQETPSMRDSK